jgi:hypothetical protein
VAVVAIIIAAIRLNTNALAMVISNYRVHYTFKYTVQKFGTYLDKKLKVDDFCLLAPKTVNFLPQLRQMNLFAK